MGVDGDTPEMDKNNNIVGGFELKIKDENGVINTSVTNIPVGYRIIPGQTVRKSTHNFDVLNIKEIYDSLIANGVGATFDGQDSAMVATQMLQYPYQQDFVPFDELIDSGSLHPHKDAINWGGN